MNKSPGIFRVVIDNAKQRWKWIVSTPLYNVYFFLFFVFGTSGIWIGIILSIQDPESLSWQDSFSAISILTYASPMAAAIICRLILVIDRIRDGYPYKTLLTFCFIYFLLVFAAFVVSFNSHGNTQITLSVLGAALVLIFSFFHGALDKVYEDVDLNQADLGMRNAGNSKDQLDGETYE